MPAAFRLSLRLFLFVLLIAPLLSGCADDEEDLVPPGVTLDAIDPASFDSERTLTGTVDPGATIEITVSTAAEVGEVLIEDGRWSATVSDLEPGLNRVLIAVQNDFNTRALQFDLFYNIVQVDQFRSVTHLPETAVFGRLQPDGTIESIRLNGIDLVLDDVLTRTGVVWSLNLSGLAEGANTLEIEAAEPEAGGQTQQVALTIIRDPEAVELTIDPLPQTQPLASDTLTLTGTVEAGAEVAVEVSPEAEVTLVDTLDPATWEVTLADLQEGSSLLVVTASVEGVTTAVGEARVEVETLPAVEALDPASGDTEVPLETPVSATFDQAVAGSTVDGESFLLFDGAMQPVAGRVEYDAEAMQALFTPEAPLEPSTLYTAELTTEIVDASGNPIPATNWSFTTAAE